MPRTATLPAGRVSSEEARRSVPKLAHNSIRELTRRPTIPTDLNGDSARIQISDESVIQRAIMLVQGKWKIAILCQLQDGPIRVGELKRRMPPISKKVLNQRLRKMEEDGLIVRTEKRAKMPHVEYALANPFGSSILYLLQTIAQWGAEPRLIASPPNHTHIDE